MSKKKNVIARAGNFEITKENGTEHDYIRIRAVGGHWSITHRDDSPMHGIWLAMCNDPEGQKWLEVRCVMEYSMSQMLYDEMFMRDWWKAVGDYNKRKEESTPTPTEQEDADAMKEVKIIEGIKNEINDNN